MSDQNKIMNKNLRKIFKDFEINEKFIANYIPLEQSYLSSFLNGERDLSDDEVMMMVNTFRFNIDYLLGKSDVMMDLFHFERIEPLSKKSGKNINQK